MSNLTTWPTRTPQRQVLHWAVLALIIWYLYPFVYVWGVHVLFMSFVFIYVYWCPTRFPYQMLLVCLTVTWPVSLVEQELLTLPGHLSSSLVLSVVHDARIYVFCVMFCRSLFVLFPVVIVLSVLRFTASYYQFGIFSFLCGVL
jgi:hypothetical protein